MLEEKKIIVDLLPVLPGGANGGAKPFAFELVRALGIVSPRCRFYLMGSDRNWNELAALESSNIHRINPDGTIRRGILERLFHRGKSVSQSIQWCTIFSFVITLSFLKPKILRRENRIL